MIQTLLQSLVEGVLRHRRRWVLGLLVLAAIAAVLGSRIAFRLDAEDFFPTVRTPDPLGEALFERVGGAGRVVVVLESNDRIEPSRAGPLLDHLAEAFRSLPGIRTVLARVPPPLERFLSEEAPHHALLYLEPAALQDVSGRLSREGIGEALERLDADPAGATVLPTALLRDRDPLGVVSEVRRAVRWGNSRVQLEDGYMSSAAGRKYFLVLEPDRVVKDIEDAQALVDGVERVLETTAGDSSYASVMQDARLFATGRPVTYVSAFRTVYRDMRRVSVASVVVVYLLLVSFFRRFLAPLILLLPVGYGLLLSAGAAFLLFSSINLLSWIFVAVLIGLGIDFALHVATHYWVYGDRSEPRHAVVLKSVLRPGRGIVFGGLTSAAAFFSTQIISYPVSRQIAWLTAIGILTILGSSFVLLPMLLASTPPGRMWQGVWSRWARGFERIAQANPRWGAGAWIVFVALSLIAARSITVETHPWSLAVRGNPKSAELERLNAELGVAFTPLLVVSEGEDAGEAMKRDREAAHLLRRISRSAGIGTIESLAQLLPALEQQQNNLRFIQQNRTRFSADRFRQDFLSALGERSVERPELVREYVPLVAKFLDASPEPLTLDRLVDMGLGDEIDRYLFELQGRHLAVSFVYLTQFPWAKGAVQTFVQVFEENRGPELEGVRLYGDALRSSSHGETLKRDGARAGLVAFVLVAGVLWFQFRSVVASAICLLPLLCGVSAVLGTMGLLGIDLNFLTMAITPILVGIGVDDGVHVVERLHRGEQPGDVLRETGASMTMTTLTTVGAFACLALATFEGLHDFGILGVVGLVVCLLASLHLVPICHRAVGRSGGRAVGRSGGQADRRTGGRNDGMT